jgi:hypothetical protein
VTLAIAASSPWGRIRGAYGDSPADQIVVFATDSRFSTRGKPPIDDGAKAYCLTKFSGMVYSGDVITAQKCVWPLRREWSRHDNPPSLDALYEFNAPISEIYAAECARAEAGLRGEIHDLQILIAARAYNGQVLGMSFNSVSDFVPIPFPECTLSALPIRLLNSTGPTQRSVTGAFGHIGISRIVLNQRLI